MFMTFIYLILFCLNHSTRTSTDLEKNQLFLLDIVFPDKNTSNNEVIMDVFSSVLFLQFYPLCSSHQAELPHAAHCEVGSTLVIKRQTSPCWPACFCHDSLIVWNTCHDMMRLLLREITVFQGKLDISISGYSLIKHFFFAVPLWKHKILLLCCTCNKARNMLIGNCRRPC